MVVTRIAGICSVVVAVTLAAAAQEARLPLVGSAMQEMSARQEVAGAVTAVVGRDRVLHLEATGVADLATVGGQTLDADHDDIAQQVRVAGGRLVVIGRP